MWSVLQAFTLFNHILGVPSNVVKLAWKSMQPEGEAEYFEAVVNSLIHKNLVDGSVDGALILHDLVREYLELKKKPIDLVTIICDQEGKLKQGRELSAIFLSIYGKRSVRILVRIMLEEAGAVFNEKYLKWMLEHLLDTNAENAILAVFQLSKATQQDAKALLHLMHGDEYQALTAARVLVWLMINVGAENLLVDGDIENFVWLCTHHLRNIPNTDLIGCGWIGLMREMANCRVFAKKMICHKPLLILMVEMIQKGDYFLECVRILMALILYVQGIKNTRLEENLLEDDKDVMREPMKSCVLDNTCMSHVILDPGENSSRDIEFSFLEPKSLFEYVKGLLQHHVQMRDRRLFPSMDGDIGRVLGCLVDSTNGAIHCGEYGCVKLLFCLEEPRIYLWDEMAFKNMMRFFNHRVIFESISSNGRIHSLVSVLKHGTKEDIMNVPWIFKYLAIGHEDIALQLIIEVGVEKVAKVVKLWDSHRGEMVELWLKHEGIAKGMILEGSICELLIRIIHQNSKVCMRVLSNLIRYHGDIVAKDLDAKGGLRLFLACYSMQPLNLTWIQLLRNMAQNKAFATKMVALGSIEMVANTLNHPMDFEHLISIAGLVRCLVEG
jgi:hypothetical protein